MMSMPLLNKVLTGTMLAQAVLVAVVYWPRAGTNGAGIDLIPVDAAQADRITIQGRTSVGEVAESPMVLVRKPEGWIIESSFGYPASEAMLTKDVLEPLDLLVGRTPIAENAFSHPALDVADSQHSRKVTVEAGSDTITLILGSSEGKAVHARLEGSDEVYKIRGFTALGFPDRANLLFDRDFQRVPVDDVRSLKIARPGEAPLQLLLQEGVWTLVGGTPPGTSVDDAKARAFILTTLNLRMLEPHGILETPEMGLDRGVKVSWTVEQDGVSSTHDYRVGSEVPDEHGRYYVKTSDQPFVYEVLSGNTQHARERGAGEFLTDVVDIDPFLDGGN